MTEKMKNNLIVLFFYIIISFYLLKISKTYNFMIYFIVFFFCINVIAVLAKKITLDIYFDSKFDLTDYQYLFLYNLYKNKYYINIIMLILCYYYSLFIITYYFFNFLKLQKRLDNAIRGFYDFEDEKIYVTLKGKKKLSNYINDIVFENQILISDLVYLEDFYFCDEIHNKMFINGYI